MSRSALATAYAPVEVSRPSGVSSPPCRLLGGSRSRPSQRVVMGPKRVRAVAPYLEAVDAPAPSARSNASRRDEPGRRTDSLRWIAVGAVSLVVLLWLITPVLARANGARFQKRLTISGYRDLGGGPAPIPVIDASSQASQAPQPAAGPQPPAPQAQSDYLLTAPPSISVRQIEAVLQQYGSPAVGLGQKLFDLGVKYGIDPVYALAFFVHESGCGTRGVARFTKSLGNIRWTDGYDNYEGYRSYPTWESGMEDWYRLVTDLYINGWNLRTVDAVVPVYAPSADRNSPPDYIASIKWMVDNWRGK